MKNLRRRNMEDLLEFVEEFFGTVYNDHNRHNLYIEIKKMDDE
jgi:hypothetical protein